MPRKTFRKIITSPELIEQINPENKRLMERFLKNYSTKKSPNTIVNYRSNLNIFFCWNLENNDNISIINIKKYHLMDFFDYAATVLAEALVTLAAVHERVGEAAEMAGGHPGLRVHEDGRVQADVVAVLLHELLPPCALDVVLQLNAEGAIVPGIGKAAVNLAAGEDEAAVLAQCHDFVHCLFCVFHNTSFPAAGCRRDNKFCCIPTKY